MNLFTQISILLCAVILFSRCNDQSDQVIWKEYNDNIPNNAKILKFHEDDQVVLPIPNALFGYGIQFLVTREYVHLPTGDKVIQTLRDDDIFKFNTTHITFTAKPELTGVYRLRRQNYDKSLSFDSQIMRRLRNEDEYSYAYYVHVNVNQIKTKILLYSRDTAISVIKEETTSRYVNPRMICLAETAYPAFVTFMIGKQDMHDRYYPMVRDYEYEPITDFINRTNPRRYWGSSYYNDRWYKDQLSYYSIMNIVTSSTGAAQNWELSHDRIDPIFLSSNGSGNSFSVKCTAVGPNKQFSETRLNFSGPLQWYDYPRIEFSVESNRGDVVCKTCEQSHYDGIKLIYEGDTIKLDCIIANDKNWDMTWRKNGSNEEASFIETFGRNERMYSLYIKSAKLSDSGDYICYDQSMDKSWTGTTRYDRYGRRVPKNEMYSERRAYVSFEVLPVTKPFYGDYPKIMPKNAEKNNWRFFSIECPLIGSPTPVYSWNFDSMSFFEMNNFGDRVGYLFTHLYWKLGFISTSTDGRTISFSPYIAWVDDHLACQATNRAGSEKFAFWLSRNYYEAYGSGQVISITAVSIFVIFLLFIIAGIIYTIFRIIRGIYRKICAFCGWVKRGYIRITSCCRSNFVIKENLNEDTEKLLDEKTIDNLTIANIESIHTQYYHNDTCQQTDNVV